MDSEVHLLNSNNDGVLDQILQYMGRTCKLEMESFSNNNNTSSRLILCPNNNNNTEDQQQIIDKSFMHLPRLDSPTTIPSIISSTNLKQLRSITTSSSTTRCFRFQKQQQSHRQSSTMADPSSSLTTGLPSTDLSLPNWMAMTKEPWKMMKTNNIINNNTIIICKFQAEDWDMGMRMIFGVSLSHRLPHH